MTFLQGECLDKVILRCQAGDTYFFQNFEKTIVQCGYLHRISTSTTLASVSCCKQSQRMEMWFLELLTFALVSISVRRRTSLRSILSGS
jgi:hypothetical protein